MAHSALGSLCLTYRLLWGPERLAIAVQLHIEPDRDTPIDAVHLLALFDNLWPQQAPQLILCIHSRKLLLDVLAHATQQSPWIEVNQSDLLEPRVEELVRLASARQARLVWSGMPGHRPAPETAPLFHEQLIWLSPAEDLQLHGLPDSPAPAALADALRQHLVQAPLDPQLAIHCLDLLGARAILGWPMPSPHQAGQAATPVEGPSRSGIERTIKAIDQDASLDAIEQSLSDNPVLIYRFLHHLSSTAAGRRGDIESLHHGLMLMGHTGLKNWLHSQLALASTNINLRPVRATLTTRAHLVAHLLDAGSEGNLRREVYLCGLLSQIDLLLGEPLAQALERIPLPARIEQALLAGEGPYRPYLDIAAALEVPRAGLIQKLSAEHGIGLEEINRALLRTLSELRSETPAPPASS